MDFNDSIWQQIGKVRQHGPLVHSITNYVVMNNTANALLAAGASPLMAHAKSEIKEIVGIAGALVVNIGTLDESWATSMLWAASAASTNGSPWVLDPVGAGASTYRNQVLKDLLVFKPNIIRGNASEILALKAGIKSQESKGVDSVHQSSDALDAARKINKALGSVVCVSGGVDYVVDEKRTAALDNGDVMMASVTGLGCSASALCGAFAAVNSDAFLATTSAMALLGVCGELAAKESKGPGSLQLNLLDHLFTIDRDVFMDTLRLELH